MGSFFSKKQTEESEIFSGPNINDLSNDILLHIFSYLPAENLCETVPSVCNRWRELINDTKFLHNVVISLRADHSREYIQNIIANFSNMCMLEIINRKDINKILFDISENCTSLCSIVIKRGVLISGEIIEQLALTNTGITILNIEAFQLTSQCIDNLQYFQNLKELRLSRSLYRVQVRIIIDSCKLITDLYVPFCMDFLDEDMMYLIGKKKETILGLLVHSHVLTQNGIQSLELCSNLKKLELSSCSGVNDISLITIATLKLRYLKCSFLRGVSSGGLSEFFLSKCLTRLTNLEINYLNMDDICLQNVALNCSSLTVLSITSCLRITNQGMEFVVKNCLKLRVLILNYDFRLTGEFLQLIPINLKYLQELHVISVYRITWWQLNALKRSLPLLNVVDTFRPMITQ